MPIEYREGDIFEQKDVNVIGHQANCQSTMGSGIAAKIRARFPGAYEVDKNSPLTPEEKFGKWTTYVDKETGKIVINAYSQFRFGREQRHTSYDKIDEIWRQLECKIAENNKTGKERILAIPYGYGSMLGGARWPIVKAIFEDIFKDSPVTLVIVKLPSQEELD